MEMENSLDPRDRRPVPEQLMSRTSGYFYAVSIIISSIHLIESCILFPVNAKIRRKPTSTSMTPLSNLANPNVYSCDVRACAIARRTPNLTTSLNYFFSPTEFAKKIWKIYSYIPSDNVL